MKKLIAFTVAILFVISTSVCFAKGVSSGGGGKSFSAPKTTTSYSSKPSTSTSGVSSNSSTKSTPYTSGGGISTSKTQQKEQREKDNHANLQTTARNSYDNHPYGGYNSWGTGFFTGMMAGSLFHPWGMVTPMGAGYGYAQAPFSMMIIYLIIDFVLLSFFIWFVYWIYKRYTK